MGEWVKFSGRREEHYSCRIWTHSARKSFFGDGEGNDGGIVYVAEKGLPIKGNKGVLEDISWVIFFADDAIAIEIQWFEDERRCHGFFWALVGVHFKMLESRGPHGEPLVAPKKMMGWATQ